MVSISGSGILDCCYSSFRDGMTNRAPVVASCNPLLQISQGILSYHASQRMLSVSAVFYEPFGKRNLAKSSSKRSKLLDFCGFKSKRNCAAIIMHAGQKRGQQTSFKTLRCKLVWEHGRSLNLHTEQSKKILTRISCQRGDAEDKNDSKTSGSTATEEAEKDEDPESPQPDIISSDNSSPGGPKNVQLDAFRFMELVGPEKVDLEDVKLLRDRVFGYTTFWVTGQEPFGVLGEGVLLLGNLRGQREQVFSKVQQSVRELFGYKYDLFMIEEPNTTEPDPRGGPRVSFLLLRKEVSDPGPTTLWQYVIAIILFCLTAGACLELGVASQLSKLPPEVVRYFANPESTNPPDLDLLIPYVESALPLAYGVFGVQLFHEVGHRLAAAPLKVEMGVPYLIPNITLGSFGAITQFKSLCPDRRAKFDISMAGPLAAALLSSAMFGVGLLLSSSGNSEQLVQVPSGLFQGSLLLGLVSRAILGYDSMHSALVAIHPLVIAGWCGLTTTALNLLPVGCTDGGRAMQAAFGKSALSISGVVTYLLLGLGVLGGPLSLPWGLYVIIVQRTPEKSCLNDVTEVGKLRRLVFVIILIVITLMLLPLWDGLSEELGIGLGSPLV